MVAKPQPNKDISSPCIYVCPVQEVVEQMKRLYLSEKAAISIETPDSDYILNVDCQSFLRYGSKALIASTATNDTIVLYSLYNLSLNGKLKGHSQQPSCVRFVPGNENLLISSATDSSVYCWDVRSTHKCPMMKFTGHEDQTRCVNTCDVSQNGLTVCAGCEQQGEDVDLLFWDIRKADTVRVFSESHTDDITCVRFHPDQKDVVMSGSTDGLICLFDVSHGSEDDALITTLNTESSVALIGWCGERYKHIYCTTHVDTLQFWDANEYDLIHNFNTIKEDFSVDYLVDVFTQDTNTQVVTGCNSGDMKVLECGSQSSSLSSVGTLCGGHAGVVRCLRWDPGIPALVSGAEDAMLCLWTTGQEAQSGSRTSSKVPSNLKQKLKEAKLQKRKKAKQWLVS